VHEPELQPRIPGVHYRKAKRYRSETVTINGRSVPRDVPVTIWEPQPPRDWDEIIMRAATGAAAGATVLSIAGTTAAIGALLARTLPAEIAFTVAGVFDVIWLACLAVEWLDRHDPRRARPAKYCGWGALVFAMGAVASYGVTLGQEAAGAVGAAVCLLAKGLWWLVLRHQSVQLGDATRYWLAQQREELAAQAALAGQLRRLDRRAAYLRAAYGQSADRIEVQTTDPDSDPDTGELLLPGPDCDGLKIEDPDGPPDGSGPGRPGRLHSVGGTPRIVDTIRALLAADPDISTDDLVEHVRDVHGDHRQLPETVARTRRRLQPGAAS
jgi:hypothetical protein